MKLIEMTVEDALKVCGKQGKVLVAVQDMEQQSDDDIIFELKKREEYNKIFEDVVTVASQMDDIVKQLRCFTVKQDIRNIRPVGVQKIVLLK